MIVLIDGYYASGKTTLLGLLDGTPGVFISPVQDDILNGFARMPGIADILKNRDFIGFRKLLINYTNFYILEHYCKVGRLNFHPSVNDISYHDFKFNFSDYERKLLIKLEDMREWKLKEVIGLIFDCMPKFWTNYRRHHVDPSVYITWGMHYQEGTKLLLEEFHDSRVISLRRPLSDIIATRLNRKPFADNFRSSYRKRVDFWWYISQGEVKSILRRNKYVDELKKRFPERVYVIQLEDIVVNTEESMSKITSFIGVIKDEKHLRFSVNSETLSDDFQNKFLGQVNDTHHLLSDEELMVISLEAGESVSLIRKIKNAKYFLRWVWMMKIKRKVFKKVSNIFRG